MYSRLGSIKDNDIKEATEVESFHSSYLIITLVIRYTAIDISTS